MELESHSKTTKLPFHRRHRCCFTTTTVALLLLFLALLTFIILIFTIFQPKNPTIHLLSASLTGISPRITFPTLRVELNLTLDVGLSVHNPNYASFKHGYGSSQLYYWGDQIGDVVTPPGNVRARKSETMEATLSVEAEKVNVTGLVSDVLGGMMRLEVRSRIPGRATVLRIVKKHVVALSLCRIDVTLPELVVVRQECRTEL